ncbi:preprotein translocase subunit SecF [Corynebacterium ciconiae DSM 44920]|uniref:protein translocase subunit SecF n=1 Tax=Corynebacterium ciconiae TaxID=227319 RepID=UPI000374B0BE|nr:protein translocase subunit SecF [Corynebacterium ciconiae]WKD61334.1 preprotein translocase subunit SecF [Corynebacterium ciconiae DSM 44920]
MSDTSMFKRLYTGEGGVDFIGKRKRWYTIAAIVILVALASIAIRGFSLGIDFQGGTKMNMPAGDLDETQVEQVFEDATGVDPHAVQIVGSGDARILEITSERLGDDQINDARVALYDAFKPKDSQGEPSPDAIGDSTVSESWGSTITKRMLLAMGVFLALVFGFIALRFEKLMGVAAIACIMVDAIVISGVYALIGFEVTPATVIGLLTVLAFSLYDTVVVFDKVSELTAGFTSSRRRTYPELANRAINQTVMRSISTTVLSALPIISLMVVAVWMLGVGTLKDLALVQLIGVVQGTLSSIFLAAPLLVTMKNRTSQVREHTASVERYRAGEEEEPETTTAAPARKVNRPESSEFGQPEALSWRPTTH